MKDRIKSFDVLRAIATVGIIVYHYSFNYIEYGIGGNHPFFAKFPTGDWGSFFVALFFMLSGASLYLTHPDFEKPLVFYYKRWLAIFPIFYLAYIPAYIGKSLELSMWNWGGLRRNFIYTILGIDGYFLNPGVNINYYRIGEWFLGAIVILYLLYPIIRFLFKNKRLRVAFSILLLLAFVWNLNSDYFTISDGKNLITCMFNFVSGMWICQYREKLNNKTVAIISAILFILVMTVQIGLPTVFVAFFGAATLFLVFLHVSDYVCRIKMIYSVVKFVSKNSFGIFLVHHLIIYAIMERYSGSNINAIEWMLLLLLNILAIFTAGFLLTIVSGFVVKGIENMVSLCSRFVSFGGKNDR